MVPFLAVKILIEFHTFPFESKFRFQVSNFQKSFATFTLRFPRTYTTIGRVSRHTYDIGTLNLQIQYPGQGDEKTPPQY